MNGIPQCQAITRGRSDGYVRRVDKPKAQRCPNPAKRGTTRCAKHQHENELMQLQERER